MRELPPIAMNPQNGISLNFGGKCLACSNSDIADHASGQSNHLARHVTLGCQGVNKEH